MDAAPRPPYQQRSREEGTMKMFDNCALLIGVDDYGVFDRSTGAPARASDLPGSRNDVRAFYRVCRELGIPAENMRVLTSPKLTPADLPGAPEGSIGEATEAEILAGITWLAERLSGHDGPPGLFTYSGHGDFQEGKGLVICPSDVATNNLDHAIPLLKIQEIFAQHAALESLTVVLDCCHAGVARGLRRGLSLTGRTVPPALAAGVPSIGERVLAAAQATGTAHQARFAGEYHGAFSWALTSTMDQWAARAVGRSVELEISYGDLLTRARALLASLSFDQIPELRGPASVAETPVFHRGPCDAAEPTAAAPNRRRPGGQLTPDLRYALAISGVTNTSWAASVTGAGASASYPMNTELWQIDTSFLTAMANAASGTTLTFAAQSFTTPRSAPPVDMPAESLWTPTAAPAGSLFLGSNGAGQVVGLACALTEGSPWGGTLTWYVGTPGGGPPQYAVGAQGITLTYGPTSAHRGLTWYTMTLPPLSWRVTPSIVAYPAAGVALAQQAGTLYLAFTQQRSGTVSCCTSADGVTWSSASTTGALATGAPALASLDGVLYLAYVEQGGSAIGVRVNSGSGWGSGTAPSASTSAPPALGVVHASWASVLCLAYLDSRSSSVQVLAWSGSRWSTPAGPGVAALGAPAIAGFGEWLMLAQQGTSSKTIEIYRASTVTNSGTTWSSTPLAVIRIDATEPTVTSDPSASSPSGAHLVLSEPGLGVYNGRLYLTFTDASQSVWICSSSDGASWSGFAKLSEQIAGVQSPASPALAALGTTTLALAYATSSNVSVLSAT